MSLCESFESEMIQHPKSDLWVVKASASWCTPCKKCAPNFLNIAFSYGEFPINFITLDYGIFGDDGYEDLNLPVEIITFMKNVKALPTVGVFAEGEEKGIVRPWNDNKVIALIEDYLMEEKEVDYEQWKPENINNPNDDTDNFPVDFSKDEESTNVQVDDEIELKAK